MSEEQSNNAGDRHLKKKLHRVTVPVNASAQSNNSILSKQQKERAINELAKVKNDHLQTGRIHFILFSFNGKEMIYTVSDKFNHCAEQPNAIT